MLSSSSRILLRHCRLSSAPTTAVKRATAPFLAASAPQRLTDAASTTSATLLLQVRGMGAAAGGDGGVPVPRSAQAKLFAGHDTNQGWESTVYFYYTLSTLLIIGVLGFAPDTTISSWAKQEAAARLHLKEQGVVKEFEFGKHYLDMVDDDVKRNWDKFDAKSVQFMKDDDDDDDEDEEGGDGGDDDDE
jgi:ESSS subunit of NADH:ubiquinone oxidoreductase (complex I)